MILQIRNENPLRYTFYLYTFTLNSSVKNLVALYEYINIKHGNDCGYMKIETDLVIRLLAEMILLRTKPIRCHPLQGINCASYTSI